VRKAKPAKRNPREATADISPAEAERQLESFLEKYNPDVAAFAHRTLAKMRKLVPGAVEMVYDNYNWLVIGFSPSERPSEAIFSIVLPPGRVTLCFLQGAGLPDPAKRLQGKGNVVRNVRLYEAGKADEKVLDDPEVRELINVALNRAKFPCLSERGASSSSNRFRPNSGRDVRRRSNSRIGTQPTLQRYSLWRSSSEATFKTLCSGGGTNTGSATLVSGDAVPALPVLLA